MPMRFSLVWFDVVGCSYQPHAQNNGIITIIIIKHDIAYVWTRWRRHHWLQAYHSTMVKCNRPRPFKLAYIKQALHVTWCPEANNLHIRDIHKLTNYKISSTTIVVQSTSFYNITIVFLYYFIILHFNSISTLKRRSTSKKWVTI